METKLERIAEIARNRPEEVFTALIHHINKDMLIDCHYELDADKAAGVDGVTKKEYEKNLVENIENLIDRMKSKSYRPKPVKRVYIEKLSGGKRPLGIPAYEDKLVQKATAKILNAIYEQDFLEFSFGFRPERSCHDALRMVNDICNRDKINYVLDTDIKGFFDNVDHEWLMKFLGHRINDPNMLRLIARFLKSGIREDGQKQETEKGTPQGGVCSPVLANIYLHYVVDIWFDRKISKQLRGESYMVRYADDIIFCFEYEYDAQRFKEELTERLEKFELELSEEKTSLVKLEDDEDDNDSGKYGRTFDFLGFTNYMGKCRDGIKRHKVKTSSKRFNRSVRRCKEWIKANRTLPVEEFMKELNRKLVGTYNYFGVSGNSRSVSSLYYRVRRLVFKWLNRRSQRKSFNWDKFQKFLNKFKLKRPKIKVDIFKSGTGSRYLSKG